MYTSINVTRISLVLNRVRRKAGMAAQAMPPSTPASSISGIAKLESLSPNECATGTI